MKKPPTDRMILKLIHDSYYDDFSAFELDKSIRETKIYVPIDCKEIARKLKVDRDIIFGRLYYHLDKKHGYIESNGSKVHLFAFQVGKDRHAVHFPLLSAIVAEHETSWFRFNLPIVISTIALVTSILGALSN